MNILVTGAAGFIGSVLANNLYRNDCNVVTIDNLSTGYKENIPSGVEFIRGDCHDPTVISQLRNKSFDAIIHIAGQSSGEISFEDPTYDLQTNTQSTLMLLDYAKKTGCTKFIYASSMSVYGNAPSLPVVENDPTNPTSFYAVGKLASEQYLKLYSNLGMNTTSLRLFNVYGPGQNLQNLQQGMVSIYLSQAIKSQKIIVKGSGDRFRDLIYIDDVVDAFCEVLSSNKSGYSCYNIGHGEAITVHNILAKINKFFNYNLSIDFVDSTPGDMNGIFSDCTLAFNDLSWRAKVPFNEGFHKMFEWAVQQKQH